MVVMRLCGGLIILGTIASPSGVTAIPAPPDTPGKITFDLSQISTDGLIGEAGSIRSLSYEFCIPATDRHLADVQAIDPTIQHFAHSRGRIGCTRGQYLCIGNTHQPNWHEKLLAIADLGYVDRIDQVVWE